MATERRSSSTTTHIAVAELNPDEQASRKWTIQYRAFGERFTLSGSNPARRDPSFQNRTYDAGLGIYDYRNRSFDPATGRFLQRDPVLGGDSLFNPYVFPGNNPVGNVDPMGTDKIVKEKDSSGKIAVYWIVERQYTSAVAAGPNIQAIYYTKEAGKVKLGVLTGKQVILEKSFGMKSADIDKVEKAAKDYPYKTNSMAKMSLAERVGLISAAIDFTVNPSHRPSISVEDHTPIAWIDSGPLSATGTRILAQKTEWNSWAEGKETKEKFKKSRSNDILIYSGHTAANKSIQGLGPRKDWKHWFPGTYVFGLGGETVYKDEDMRKDLRENKEIPAVVFFASCESYRYAGWLAGQRSKKEGGYSAKEAAARVTISTSSRFNTARQGKMVRYLLEALDLNRSIADTVGKVNTRMRNEVKEAGGYLSAQKKAACLGAHGGKYTKMPLRELLKLPPLKTDK
jgi:RHS repeat-associated protein